MRDGVSNLQPRDCLLNRLFRRRSKKTSKLRATGLCAENSPVTGEFPAQMASSAENVSIWWRNLGIDLAHCCHINRRSINWNSSRQFAHIWLFCWALAKSSTFFCWGVTITGGSVRLLTSWKGKRSDTLSIENCLLLSWLEDTDAIAGWITWIIIAFLKRCSHSPG